MFDGSFPIFQALQLQMCFLLDSRLLRFASGSFLSTQLSIILTPRLLLSPLPQSRHPLNCKSQFWSLFSELKGWSMTHQQSSAFQVVVLSMHQSFQAHLTDVVFGVIDDPVNVPFDPLSLSLLRSSFIELYLKETNLSLTASLFGQPSEFEILKFLGGLTIVPSQSFSVGQLPHVLFNFTLHNSISDIEDNFSELRDQLESGLGLGSNEKLFMLVTSKNGSTVNPPVIVQASIMTATGLLAQRLKQLAQVISDYSVRNLGLNNSIFGKVKSISLSSHFNGYINEYAPTASPAPSPSPEQSSPYPTAPSPCFNCTAGSPQSVNRNASAPPQKSSSHHSFAHYPPPMTYGSAFPFSMQSSSSYIDLITRIQFYTNSKCT